MIKHTITARKLEVDQELKEYIERKLGRLDKYFPRTHQPESMRVELHRDEAAEPDKRYHVTAQISVSGPDLQAETATINPHSAVDIIEAKLKDKIRKYKAKHSPRRFTLKRETPQPQED
ncbi:MAG: ribosome-associated translation inhibitor RaiA [Candidatus Saccharibacteria bacterium]|jgi:ribosomal subunit interface protein